MSETATDPRRRLLQVASRLFYADGIHAVGIDRVIAEAHVAKATLYAHFPSKADLVAAYLADESERWVDAARERCDGARAAGGDPVRALFELLHDRSCAVGYRGCPFINAAAEFPEPGPVADEIAAHRARLRTALADAAARRAASPAVVDALVALFSGAMSAAHLDHDPGIVLHAADAAERVLGPAGRPAVSPRSRRPSR